MQKADKGKVKVIKEHEGNRDRRRHRIKKTDHTKIPKTRR